jgi:hypothetical protein
MTTQRMMSLLTSSVVILAFLAVSLYAMPTVLFLLAKEHLLTLPEVNGPQLFLVIGRINGICLAPVFIGLHVWRMSPRIKKVVYIVAGVAAPFPLEFLFNMGFSALADESELEARLYSLGDSIVFGAVSGLLFGFLTWWRTRWVGESRQSNSSSPLG